MYYIIIVLLFWPMWQNTNGKQTLFCDLSLKDYFQHLKLKLCPSVRDKKWKELVPKFGTTRYIRVITSVQVFLFYNCSNLITGTLSVGRGNFPCIAALWHSSSLLLSLLLLLELGGVMMVQIHVHCAASNPDASATGHRFTILYLHPDASLIYWPLLELEWTPGSVRLLNLPVDEAKRGAVTVATLRSHFLHTLRLPSSLRKVRTFVILRRAVA